jgi:hypothetical protein
MGVNVAESPMLSGRVERVGETRRPIAEDMRSLHAAVNIRMTTLIVFFFWWLNLKGARVGDAYGCD